MVEVAGRGGVERDQLPATDDLIQQESEWDRDESEGDREEGQPETVAPGRIEAFLQERRERFLLEVGLPAARTRKT